VAADALALLQGFDWPGNVRQLVNACRRLTVTAPGPEIQVADIPEELGGAGETLAGSPEWSNGLARWAEHQLDKSAHQPLLESALPEFEKALIRTALARARGHRQEAAKLLGWGRNTLTRKIRELRLDL
jgi:two-component system nitrogen regulation response regulator GlnG